jgi:surface protein
MFYNCTSLTDVALSNWKIGSKTALRTGVNLGWMFGNCSKLTNVNLVGWDVSHVTKMNNMFYGCSALQSMNMANWDVSNVTTLEGMFASCGNLKSADMTNWQPSSVTTLYSLFYNCTNLQTANVGGWKMPELLTTSHMFRGCNNMTTVNVSDWYTPSLTSMDAMFHTCYAVTELDVSSFDTSKCQEISQVFEACSSLHTIHGLNNWDTSSAGTFEECFSGASALKVLDLSSFSSQSVVPAHPMQNNATGWGFRLMLNGMSSLEKLIMSENFSFTNEGTVTNYPAVLPSPMKKAGFTAKWRNVETGELYDASEIPEKTAATYEAYYEAIP